MTVKLIRIDRSAPKEEYTLDQFPVVIGRAEHAAVRIECPLISRLHCQIVRQNERLIVNDLNSTLGTLVNLQDVQEMELYHGDLLTVGPFTYRVVETGRGLFAAVCRIWKRAKNLFATRRHRSLNDTVATEPVLTESVSPLSASDPIQSALCQHQPTDG